MFLSVYRNNVYAHGKIMPCSRLTLGWATMGEEEFKKKNVQQTFVYVFAVLALTLAMMFSICCTFNT